MLNRGELFFWFCVLGLQTKTSVKSFDSFVVGGWVKDIEEASDRALKGIDCILPPVVENGNSRLD